VFAADHIYRMDVQQMADFHAANGADVTVSALAVPIEKARGFGILKASADARVLDFREKPKHPAPTPGDPRHAYASMGNYLFEPQVLGRLLEEARSRGEVDFGRDLLPRICKSDKVVAYDFAKNHVPGVQEFEERGYWRDVGTLSALAAAQQDAMGSRPRFNLWNARWPIRGEYELAPPAAVAESVAELKAPALWRGGRRDRHTDERVPTS
jgi:glucose-1-phosphate adenylyltransferase